MQKSELLRLICGITKERSVGLLGNCFAQGQTLYKEPNMNPDMVASNVFLALAKSFSTQRANSFMPTSAPSPKAARLINPCISKERTISIVDRAVSYAPKRTKINEPEIPGNIMAIIINIPHKKR